MKSQGLDLLAIGMEEEAVGFHQTIHVLIGKIGINGIMYGTKAKKGARRGRYHHRPPHGRLGSFPSWLTTMIYGIQGAYPAQA